MSEVSPIITFFSPTMQRTGSEIALFNLLSRISSKHNITLISKYKGDLQKSLPVNIKYRFIHNRQSNKLFIRLINRLTHFIFFKFHVKKYLNSVWYVNTISMPEIISYAVLHNIQLVLHVHELEQRFKYLNANQMDQVINYPKLIIANSITSYNLLVKLGRKERIELCYPSINTILYSKNNVTAELYRKKLKIPKDYFIWVMCGAVDENKNPELFIEIANLVRKKINNVIFLWIGPTPDKAYFLTCKTKANQLGLNKIVLWQTHDLKNYFKYFQCADGFLLTSKKESFSLVTLEALLLGIPVVGQNCGGISEILSGLTGVIVDKENDAVAMSEAIANFTLGKQKVNPEVGKSRAFEFDISLGFPKWLSIMNKYFS